MAITKETIINRELKTGTCSNKNDDMNFVNHLKHPLALTIRSLLLREERRRLNKMIIDDEENILQAIDSNIKLNQLFTTDLESLSKKFFEKIPLKVPLVNVSLRTSKKLFGNEKSSRIFAIADMPKPRTFASLAMLPTDIIILDNLCIRGNIGAIIRTSVALDVSGMVLLDTEPVDVYDRRLIRASRGLVFKLPIITMDTSSFIKSCREKNIKILITTPYAQRSIEDAICLEEKFAIVLGGEKEGCSKELKDAADIEARIPINSVVESLNVSVAASIILYLRNLNYKTKINNTDETLHQK